MKKIFIIVTTLLLFFTLSGCGEKKISIGVPNDATNEARALLLLDDLGFIVVDKTKGINITKNDIIDSKNVKIVELSAEQLPVRLQDLDYAVINGNYALSGGVADKLIEGCVEASDSIAAQTYGNIIAVQAGNEATDKTKALISALKQDNIKQYINNTYNGLVLPRPTEDIALEFANGNNTKIIVGASSTPHAEILEQAKAYLLERGYVLEIRVFTDYVMPNIALDEGSIDANYFQHLPYLESFNESNDTNIVSVLNVHYEPLGLYSVRHTSINIEE